MSTYLFIKVSLALNNKFSSFSLSILASSSLAITPCFAKKFAAAVKLIRSVSLSIALSLVRLRVFLIDNNLASTLALYAASLISAVDAAFAACCAFLSASALAFAAFASLVAISIDLNPARACCFVNSSTDFVAFSCIPTNLL